jgi:hypothetical protein
MKVIYVSGYTEGAFSAGSGEGKKQGALQATLLERPSRLDIPAATVREALASAISRA